MMNNFKILLLQELAEQMKSFTFGLMIPVAFVISLLVSSLQVMSFKDRQDVFREQELKSKEALQQVYSYSQLKVDVFIPPNVLSIFSLGLDESIGNKVTVSILDQPELQTTAQRGNAFIGIFNNLDISGIVKILSIFIVLIAACPIVKDKEKHIRTLIFANTVGRFEYLLSKFASLFIVVFILVFIIFIIPTIWISIDPKIETPFSIYNSVFLMIVSSILYLSIFVLISIAISALSSKMSMATLASLMIWALLVYIYPYTVNSVIDRFVSITSDNEISKEIDQIDRAIMFENVQFLKNNDAFISRSWCSMESSHILGLITQYRTAPKDYFEKVKITNDFILPKWEKRIVAVNEIKEKQKAQLRYKKTLYNQAAFFLPDRIYQALCEQITGTDFNYRERAFSDAVKSYRSTLMNYIQSKGGFSYAFFTQVPESMMCENYEDYPLGFEQQFCKDLKPLSMYDMPQFDVDHHSNSLTSWVGIGLLCFIVGVFSFSICYININKI